MTATLKIPRRIADNFGDPVLRFINFTEFVRNNVSVQDEIEMDFTETIFVNPFLVGGLAHIASVHEQSGGKVSMRFKDGVDSIRSYLETIYFYSGFDYASAGGDQMRDVFESYHAKTYTPIVRFPTALSVESNQSREKNLSALNQILKNQLSLKGDFAMGVYYLIDELTQNIVDHSGAAFGTIFAQYFPSKNFMDICITDTGKGLLQSYLDTNKHAPGSHAEALNFAVYGKSTKDIPESRGFGLSTSRNMLVNGLKGKFLIMSGNAFFIQTAEREEVVTLPDSIHVQGCYIALRIPILDQKEFNLYNYME